MTDSEKVIDSEGNPIEADKSSGRPEVFELVEQPAKVMRIGSMIRQLLEEVKSAPLDEASRMRLREVFELSITELKDGLAPELVEELDRLNRSFDVEAPSEAELRVAQAQLVGWLEGLFHGIQAAIHAQQVQAQNQLRTMRLELPNAAVEDQTTGEKADPGSASSGMYL